MSETLDGPPVVPFPPRLDRRLRLGPFASGRAAVKFLAYAAVGAAFVPSAVPMVGVPVILVGFVVTVWAPDGEPIDERVVVYLRYAVRRAARGSSMSPRYRPRGTSAPAVQLSDGRWLAVLRAEGAPFAYLPPDELARRFASYRQLLESVDGELRLRIDSAAIRAAALRPRGKLPDGREAVARAGYTELVGVLARRRAVRRVRLGLVSGVGGADDRGRLEVGVENLERGLVELGVRAERLVGTELADASAALGLAPGGTEG